ncbi:MAG: phosphoglucomutase/phosphomannomutase family protein [Candidatus Omnitrophica bacterium]|nr:phosphoglucomutase/phosphomannomutase family protein [Candidatus Omnitrophota bacterium]
MGTARQEIKFGTDGWRGVIGDDFTFENVRLVAQAIADYYNSLKSPGGQPVVGVGFDTRFQSDRFAQAVSEVLAANGIEVVISDRCVPTPALSFAVKHRGLTAGVMITASHNPGAYNGIKIKTAQGGAAGVEITRQVERLIQSPGVKKDTCPARVLEDDLTHDYVDFLREYIDFKRLRQARFKVLVDPMHGSGNSFLADVLKGSTIKLDFMRQDVNPCFEGGRPEPVLENLKPTVEKMRKGAYDLCIVLDGDADRIAAFAGKGEFINPQKVLGLLILHLIQDRGMSGGVVKTIVGSNLVDNICHALRLKLYETPVGFKFISELMVKENILIGGEEAGGMGFKNYIPERDGSLAGLLLLEMMAYRKKPMLAILKEMEREFGRYYYVRTEVRVKSPGSVDLTSLKNTNSVLGVDVAEADDSDGLKFTLRDRSWLMLRTSGTEPIIRVYAESENEKTSFAMLEFGKELIEKNVVPNR